MRNEAVKTNWPTVLENLFEPIHFTEISSEFND